MLKILWALAALALVPTQAQAWLPRGGGSGSATPPPVTEFFVATNGNDSNNGDLATPFLTLGQCQVAMQGSSIKTCTLRGGTYTQTSALSFTATDDGETWQSYPGESAVISGGQAITGWSLFDAGNNVWRASGVNWNFRELYVNDLHANRATHTLTQFTKTGSGFTTTDSAAATWTNVTDLEFVQFSGFNMDRCLVASISTSGGTSTVTMASPCWSFTSNTLNGKWVENAYQSLIASGPGTFYLDRVGQFLYYIPRAGETSGGNFTATVVAPKLEQFFAGTSVANLAFKRLTFAYSGETSMDATDGGYGTEQSGYHCTNGFVCSGDSATHLLQMPPFPGAIVFSSASNHITFDHDLFTHIARRSLRFDEGSQDVTVTASQFIDNAAGAIQFGGILDYTNSSAATQTARLTARDNYFGQAFEYWDTNDGIFQATAQGSTIDHNEFAGSNWNSLSIGYGWTVLPSPYSANNTVTNNYIHSFCLALVDCGAIYTNDAQPGYSASGNYMLGGDATSFGCIYGDEASSFETWTGNVCNYTVNANWLWIFGSSANHITAQNNWTTVAQFTDGGTSDTISSNTLYTGGSPPAGAALVVLNAGITAGVIPGPGTVPYEEFVGPLAGWKNAKTDYGAAGNGTTDDTTAIQNGLNGLGSAHPVLYVPAGTYKITSTVTLANVEGVSVICHDPSDTTILWAGSGSPVMTVDGVAYSRFNRCTFDGAGTASIAVNQSSTGGGGFFDTANEYTDDVFQNSTRGLECGAGAGNGCAETSVLRSTFNNNTYGVHTGNANALDMWVWYSRFNNNTDALTNLSGAGSFHSFSSIFQGSTDSDILIGNTGLSTYDDNYSSGSQHFLWCIGPSGNPNQLTAQRNTWLDTTVDKFYCGDYGPVVLLDNTIRSQVGATAPIVEVNGDLFSGYNTYTVSSPLLVTGPLARSHSVEDQVVSRGTINPSPPTLPGTPPNLGRTIEEVTAGSSASTIQTAVNAAAAAGTRAVVHLQAGSYSVGSTINVPPYTDLQIIGDGILTTDLSWSGGGGGIIFQLTGPSRATLRDLSLNGTSGAATCVAITNADQRGSRVFMDQASALGNGLFAQALDYTNIELHNSGFAGASTNGIEVSGGTLTASSSLWPGAQVSLYAGAGYGNNNLFKISGNAHLVVRQFWNDNGGTSNTLISVANRGALSLAGLAGFVNNGGSSSPLPITNFTGNSALVNVSTADGTDPGTESITGSSAGANNLSLGMEGRTAAPFSDTSSPADTSGYLNGQTIFATSPGEGSKAVAESGTSTNAFLDTTLGQLRSTRPMVTPWPLPRGITDAQIRRVFAQNCVHAFHITH